MAEKLQSFVTRLLQEAAKVVHVEVTKDTPVDSNTGLMTLSVNGSERQLPLLTMFGQYSQQCQTDTDRACFIGQCIQTYFSSDNSTNSKAENSMDAETSSMMSLDTASGKLRPLLTTRSWIIEKNKALPKKTSVPYCSMLGIENMFTDSLALVTILDLGSSCVPVTDTLLQHWGISFAKSLDMATRELSQRTAHTRAWDVHPTNCASSGWKDGFDATRVVLFPNILADRKRPASNAGDVVAMFVAANHVLTSGSKNPIGLCLMGDLTLDWVEKTPLAIVHTLPFRLIPIDPISSSSSDSIISCASILRRSGYTWVRYYPNNIVSKSGEFSVPRTRKECEEILKGTESGRVPIYPRDIEMDIKKYSSDIDIKKYSSEDSSTSKDKSLSSKSVTVDDREVRANAQREAGNVCFRKKDYAKALKYYDIAAELNPSDVAALSNRSAVLLRLHRYIEAFIAADEVILISPLHSKAFYRRGMARLGFKDWKGAIQDFTKLLEISESSNPPDKKNATIARTQLQKAKDLSKEDDVATQRYCAEVQLAMECNSKGEEFDIATLLHDSIGWTAEPKEGGMPGWIPGCVEDSDLYSLLRDSSTSTCDRMAKSAYLIHDDVETKDVDEENRKLIPIPSSDSRKNVLKKLSELNGERSLMLLAVANPSIFGTCKTSPVAAFKEPLEKRTLSELLACICSVSELRRVRVMFEKVLANDTSFQELLNSGAMEFRTKTPAQISHEAMLKARDAKRADRLKRKEAKLKMKNERVSTTSTMKKKIMLSETKKDESKSIKNDAITMNLDVNLLNSLKFSSILEDNTSLNDMTNNFSGLF